MPVTKPNWEKEDTRLKNQLSRGLYVSTNFENPIETCIEPAAYDNNTLWTVELSELYDVKAYLNNKEIITYDSNTSSIVNITYSELYDLYKKSQLTTGQRYRITDYVTKVLFQYSEGYYYGYMEDDLMEIKLGADSKEKPFDLIVIANSEKSLYPKAIATVHKGDTSFTEKELSYLEIWYSIENKKHDGLCSREGKGVIYRMIDHSTGNECLYDFKNVVFDGKETFGKNCYNNKIYGMQILIGDNCSNNVIGLGSKRIRIGNNSNGNTFGSECRGITLGDYCNYNSFGNGCVYDYDVHYGSVGGGFWLNDYTPRNYCSYNTFDNGCCVKVCVNGTSNSYKVLQYLHISAIGEYVEKSSSDGVTTYSEIVPIINITEDVYNSNSKIYVENNSKKELKVYKLADLIK